MYIHSKWMKPRSFWTAEMSNAEPRPFEPDLNIGIFDGEVSHAEVNQAISLADKAILFGEQTRLPYFPEDVRLPKLHAGDPLVLLFWKVFKKLPGHLREVMLDAPISITLVRGGGVGSPGVRRVPRGRRTHDSPETDKTNKYS